MRWGAAFIGLRVAREDDMNDLDQPLVVGAGPVGLGAALFLARQGRIPMIVEMGDEMAQQSKALAVNPRTLDILRPTGVTQRMLERGLPIHEARMYRRGRVVTTLSLAGIHPRYPFMLALSQATTERLLVEALEELGVVVDRGVKMVECRNVSDGVEVELEPSANGCRKVVHCPWLLAADGAHSVARQQLGVDFAGTSFPAEWHLADVPLRTSLAADCAHAFFLDGGAFLFLIRVINDIRNDRGAIWRVIGNRPDPLAQLVQAEPAGGPLWTSGFRISHRINATMAAGRVYFAGDAAHIHSPMGARGMNLGLEDAWVFAELVRANRLPDYDRLRRPVDRRVVHQVELLSCIVSAESRFYQFVREFVFPTVVKIPFLRGRITKTMTGLDHELPAIGVGQRSQQPRQPSFRLRSGGTPAAKELPAMTIV
jgi:2-polyprenyl-6-methoxyphenol hydroxylase-like FAD-dependent oxidoreductase